MNEISEVPKEQSDISTLPEIKDMKTDGETDFLSSREAWDYFVKNIRDCADLAKESEDIKPEVREDREYGVSDCADIAIKCFTSEVITGWNGMDINSRNAIIQEYANGIGAALGINFKGIIWENFQVEDGRYLAGFNSGDGYVHLNLEMLSNPAKLMLLIDTVAHEARHQLQNEAMADPAKFPIDMATINEWRVGKEVYTTEMPSAYDPWGYVYNPMELDSVYFGGSMVRELTKHIINSRNS